MRLSLSCLSVSDFKSFKGGPHTLDFDDMPMGLCYLKGRNDADKRLGSNGSGKSSLWDAVTWCLYGKTSDELRNPDIRSWFGGKTAVVSLGITIDADDYEITRQANPNRLRINDKDVGQDEIEALIELNFETFLNTILLGQGRPLFFDLEPRAKLQLFSDVLNLSRWEERSKTASSTVSDLEAELLLADREFTRLQAKADQLQVQIDETTRLDGRWADNQQQQIAELEERVMLLQAQYDAIALKYVEFDCAEDMATAQHQLAQKDNNNMFEALFKKRDELAELKLQRKSISLTIANLREQIAELGESDTCPTCGQSVQGTDLDKHKKEIRKKIRKQTKLLDGLDDTSLAKEYADMDKNVQAFRDVMTQAEDALKKLRGDVVYWRKRCTEAEVKLKRAQNELDFLCEQTNPYAKQKRLALKNLKEIKSCIAKTNRTKKRLETSIRRTKYWVKGFKDIRLLVMEEVLQELELVTTAMMQDVGLVNWHIKYDIEKETQSGTIKRGLNLEIYNPDHGKSVKWKSWSGGEAQRLRIIGSLALAQVLLNHAGVTTDMEILDEPIRHMGEEGVEDLCEMLHNRSRDLGKQIWYVDHHTVENTLFDAVVEVVKSKDRCSSIIMS